MFASNNSQSQTQYQSDLQLTYTKREQFRMEIRRRQIEQIKKQIRQKFKFSDPNDASLLRKIDLNKLIYELKNTGINQQIIHGMFLYATSKSSDHLYTLFDQKVITILIDNMVQRQFQYRNHQNYTHFAQLQRQNNKQHKLVWDRKIFWIITNFTSQSTVLHQRYLQNLYEIANYLQQFEQSKANPNNQYQIQFPFYQQTQQNVILSLSNLLVQSSNCRQIIYNHPNLFYKIFERIHKRKPKLSDIIKQSKDHTPKIIIYYCQLVHNIYSIIEYDQISQDIQKLVLKQIRRVLFALVTHRILSEEDKKVVLLFLDAIIKLFGHTLDNKPKYLLMHKKQFWKLSEWFDTFIKTQPKSEKGDQIIISYINLLQVIYGPNIPEDIEQQVDKFYQQFFQKHVGKVCTSAFGNTNQLFHLHILGMLQPILLQQFLAQMIATEYLEIVSRIFEHIKKSSFGLKKQALLCLINMIKSTIYHNSTSQGEILQLLVANKIADLFAYNVWAYVDTDLNLQLLEGIIIILKAEANQYQSKLRFWESFQEAGGIIRLEKLIDQSGNAQLRAKAIKLLDQAKNKQEM